MRKTQTYRFDGKWLSRVNTDNVELARLFLKDGTPRMEIIRMLRNTGIPLTEAGCTVMVAEDRGELLVNGELNGEWIPTRHLNRSNTGKS